MCKKICQLLFITSINLLFLGQVYGDAGLAKNQPVVKEITLTAIYFNKVALVDSFEFFPLYEEYLGARVQLLTLRKICNDITNHYRIKGYDFARCTLPPEGITEGIVKMHIVEGVIGAVRLEGDVEESDRLINSYIEQIALDEPLNDSQLRYVEQMLNAIPGITVNTYTRAMQDSQKLELIFDVKQLSFSGEVYANNRGSKVIGPVQAGLSLASYSLLGVHEYLRLHLLTTEETEELKFVEVNSSWPVGNEGSQLIVESSYANSRPGDLLGPAKIDIDFSTASLGWSKPLKITASDTLLLTAAIDYIRSEIDISGSHAALDDLYIVRLSLDYITNKTRHYTKTNISLSLGIKELNTTEVATNDPPDSFVSTGKEDFSAAKFDFFYRIILLKNLFLSNQIQGQYAFRDLPVSENIVFGGEVIGSAYDPAELFGDHGLGAKSRLSYQLENASITSTYTQFYIQYDIAKVWNNTLNVISSAASLATGLTIGSNVFYLDLQAAKPLTKTVLLEGNKDTRFFASARLFF